MFLVRYKLYAEMLPASGGHCTVLVVSSTAEKRSSQLSGTLNPELLHGFNRRLRICSTSKPLFGNGTLTIFQGNCIVCSNVA